MQKGDKGRKVTYICGKRLRKEKDLLNGRNGYWRRLMGHVRFLPPLCH